ncbi:hypothetical protein CFOL_v3_21989, partial [Cephalotus follicularis]
ISFIDLPILNPYHVFTKPHNSIIKSIKSIIQPQKICTVTTLVQAVEPVYRKNKNEKVKIVFSKKSEERETITLIFSPLYQLEHVLVISFDYQGKPIYEFSNSDGNKYWDIFYFPKCVYDDDDEDDRPS